MRTVNVKVKLDVFRVCLSYLQSNILTPFHPCFILELLEFEFSH